MRHTRPRRMPASATRALDIDLRPLALIQAISIPNCAAPPYPTLSNSDLRTFPNPDSENKAHRPPTC